MARVRAVKGPVGTGRGAWLIATVVAVAIVVVYLGELNRPAPIQTGEGVTRLVQTGPTYRHATGTGDLAVNMADAVIPWQE